MCKMHRRETHQSAQSLAQVLFFQFHEAMYHTDHHTLQTCTTGCTYAGQMIETGYVLFCSLLACWLARAHAHVL